jgi:hypothetical protein
MPLNLTDRFGRSPIYNDKGDVAMRYLRDNHRVMVTCGPEKDKRSHVFHTRFAVSLAWVPEQDVPCCMAVTSGCCGQKRAGVIIFATAAEIQRWTDGTRL